jgi:beta-glucosidase
MEMPSDAYFGATLAGELDAGSVPESRLDDMVTRILTSMFQAGLFDRAPSGSLTTNEATPADATLARSVAAQGVVLLKTSPGLLPLDPSTVTSIAVIGDAGDTSPVAQGTGSSNVTAPYLTTPLEGITARAGAGIVVKSASNDVTAAAALASQSDVAIVVVGVTSGEGADRATLALPDGDDALVAAVVAANPRTVVVVYAPAQVLMPWASTAPAIVLGWLPGQEEGSALASVLFGDMNPSGKLPMTFAVNAADYPASSAAQFPGVDGDVTYSEGVRVGYRDFDALAVAPLFPFGHGLSYTTFDYATLSVSPSTLDPTGDVTVTLDVSNSGAVAEWVAYPGVHEIMIGSSSRDIRLNGSFTVKGGPSPT